MGLPFGLISFNEASSVQKKSMKNQQILKKIKSYNLPLMELIYAHEPPMQQPKVRSSHDAAEYLRKEVYNPYKLNMQECFYAVYLNRANLIIGAILCNAEGIILSHNHPSSQAFPSDADRSITDKIKSAAKMMDLNLLDHIILTHNSYYSFADEGLI